MICNMQHTSCILRVLFTLSMLWSSAAAEMAANKPQSDVPALKPGKTLRLIQRQTGVKSQRTGPVTVVIEVPIEVSVLRVGDDGVVIRWKRGVTKIVDVDSADLRRNPDIKPLVMKMTAEQLGPIAATTDNLTTELAFDRDLQYAGLRNYDDVAAAANRAMDELDKLRAGRGLPPIEAAIRKAMFNRSTLEYSMTKEALLYFGWMALPMQRGETGEFEGLLPNQFGGDPTPATVSAELAAEPDAQGRLVLRTTSQVDVEKYIKSLRKAIENTPGAKPLEPDAEQQLRDLKIGSTAEHHIDPATGLATLATVKSAASVGGKAQSEEFHWTVAPAER